MRQNSIKIALLLKYINSLHKKRFMYFSGFIQGYVKKLATHYYVKEVFDIDGFCNNEEDRLYKNVKYF